MFQLTPNPTFPATIDIKKHGGGTIPLKLDFKYRTADELEAFIKADSTLAMSNAELIMALVAGWREVDEPFTLEAVTKLCQHYKGAPIAIRDRYLEEITQARLGN